MLVKRIIPCLDMLGGRVVKGINFINIKDVGDPVECAKMYEEQGADEIVFLDINATHEGRGITEALLRRTVKSISIPLTAGGGIRSIDDFEMLLRAGAYKISVNTAAVQHPELIAQASARFGSQCVVVAIDACQKTTASEGGEVASDGYKEPLGGNFGDPSAGNVSGRTFESPGEVEYSGAKKYNVLVNGGRVDTGKDLIDWALEAEALGAGEILLTSMDADGTKAGFDLDMLNAVSSSVRIPVIASGGGGSIQDFIELFKHTDVDAALAASVFHYGELTVSEVKKALSLAGIPVRL